MWRHLRLFSTSFIPLHFSLSLAHFFILFMPHTFLLSICPYFSPFLPSFLPFPTLSHPLSHTRKMAKNGASQQDPLFELAHGAMWLSHGHSPGEMNNYGLQPDTDSLYKETNGAPLHTNGPLPHHGRLEFRPMSRSEIIDGAYYMINH